jgi:serine/arginine repetitive matrix protein 1
MVVRGSASAAQDGRFSRKQQKELSKLKMPPEYKLKVDFKKIILAPINAWVVKRVKELLKGLDDEVLVGTIVESLKQGIEAKDLHYELTPFLCNNTTLFIKELWSLLHSASESESGIPQAIEAEERARLETRRQELAAHQAKVEAARERQKDGESSHRHDRQASHSRRPPSDDLDHQKRLDMHHNEGNEQRMPRHNNERQLDIRRKSNQRAHSAHGRDTQKDRGFSMGARDGTRLDAGSSLRERSSVRHQRTDHYHYRDDRIQQDSAQRQGDESFRRAIPATASQFQRGTGRDSRQVDLEGLQARHRSGKRSKMHDETSEDSDKLESRNERLKSAEYNVSRNDRAHKPEQDRKGHSHRYPENFGKSNEKGEEKEAWACAGGMGSGGFPREGRAAKLLQDLKRCDSFQGEDSPQHHSCTSHGDDQGDPNSPSPSKPRDRRARELSKHSRRHEDGDATVDDKVRESGEGRDGYGVDGHKSKKHKADKMKHHKKHKERKHHKHSCSDEEIYHSPQR